MTVAEVIAALSTFEQSANVYVPDIRDGTAQIAKNVNGLVHTECPDGISIPPDVCIIPWTDEEFNDLQVADQP